MCAHTIYSERHSTHHRPMLGASAGFTQEKCREGLCTVIILPRTRTKNNTIYRHSSSLRSIFPTRRTMQQTPTPKNVGPFPKLFRPSCAVDTTVWGTHANPMCPEVPLTAFLYRGRRNTVRTSVGDRCGEAKKSEEIGPVQGNRCKANRGRLWPERDANKMNV